MSSRVVSVVKPNPFGANKLYSTYATWQDGELVYPFEPERRPAPLAGLVHHRFRTHILSQEFPCVGGKAAINTNAYRFSLYPAMNTRAATAGLAHDLWEYAQERPTLETEYATFIASFAAPVVSDEREWEQLLWAQLQSLHELDRPHHAWDSTVSSDPESPDFSFSFAGTAFFIVGLHPASSRLARRFAWPTLVFNAHTQFERLREQHQFERMREMIRTRDYKLQGSLNPNLSNHGELSEARQYSGRAVEGDWKCPFRALAGEMKSSVD